jgi:hypothetical protein
VGSGQNSALANTQHVSRNTFHATRFTQHVSRFTFHVSRGTHSFLIPHSSFLAAAQATPVPLDYADYVAALHTAYRAVAARQGGAARAVLPPEAVVRRDAGDAGVRVDLAPVRAALEREPPDWTAAEARLRAWLDLLDPGALPPPTPGPGAAPGPGGGGGSGPLATPPVDDPTAQARLDEVLRDPRFQYTPRNSLQQMLANFFRPIVAALFTMDPVPRGALVGGVAGLIVWFILLLAYRDQPWSRGRKVGQAALGGAAVAGAVFVLMVWGGDLLAALAPLAPVLLPVGGVLAALVAIAVFGLGLRRGRGRTATRLPTAAHREAEWTAAQARAAADEAAAAGDFRRAIRYRYLATMLALDEAGHLRFDRALTNREHLRRAPVALRDPLRPLVLTFDRTWYGGLPAGADDYRAYTAQAGAVEAVPVEPEAHP